MENFHKPKFIDKDDENSSHFSIPLCWAVLGQIIPPTPDFAAMLALAAMQKKQGGRLRVDVFPTPQACPPYQAFDLDFAPVKIALYQSSEAPGLVSPLGGAT